MITPMSYETWYKSAAAGEFIPGRKQAYIEGQKSRDAEIDALKAELAQAKDALDAAYQLGATWQEGKAIELEQNAARYRLMRNQVFDIRKVAFICGDALDAAIDAAMKGQS